LPLENKKRSEK